MNRIVDFKVIILITSFFLTQALHAQKPNIRFEYLGNENGLASNYLDDVIQDHDGFIWFATDKGICRYDGSNFRTYNSDIDFIKSPSFERIYSLYVDSNNDLWIGSLPAGISRYNRDKDIFINYALNDSTGVSNSIHRIFEDASGTIWIGTEAGLFKFSQELDSVIQVLETDIILSFIEDKGYLWLGTNNEGIIIFNKNDNKVEKRYFHSDTDKGSIPGNAVYDMKRDLSGDLWITTNNGGFCKYNAKHNSFESLPVVINGEPITEAFTNVYFASSGMTYLAGDNLGLITLNESKTKAYQYFSEVSSPFGFKANTVTGIIEDHQKSIWLSTFAGGVYHFSSISSSIKQYKAGQEDGISLSHPYVSGFTEDNSGNLWIGLDGGGINILNRTTGRIENISEQINYKAKAVTGFAKDSKGKIWASTWRSGYEEFVLENYDINYNVHKGSKLTKVHYENLKSILIDSKERIWIANHFSGISIFDQKEKKLYTKDNPGKYNNKIFDIPLISCILEDSQESMWIVTYSGLFKYVEKDNLLKSYRGYIGTSQEPSEKVIDICMDWDNDIWITTNMCVYKYLTETDEFENYTQKCNLPSSFSLLCNKEHLWLATAIGIIKFDIVTESMEVFDDGYSIQGNAFSERAAYETFDGYLCFGSKDGFLMFHPELLKTNKLPPQVHITGIDILGKKQNPNDSISILTKQAYLTDKIEIKHDQSVITLHYTAMNFIFPEKNQYRYKLEGFDKDWRIVDNERKVTYTNLNPGEYNFIVEASNNDGVWCSEGNSLIIEVLPPYHKTIWFKGLIIIISFILAYSYYRIKVKNISNRRILLEQEVNDRTLEINLANDALNERNTELSNQKEEVESQRDLIKTQNIELEQHRNHLKELVKIRTNDLEAAKNKAEESDKLKTAFLHNLSHEIRTPLNAIIGFTEVLNEPSLSKSEIAESKQIITRSSHSLLGIIDDIIQASLIESNQLEVNRKEVDIVQMLNELHSDYQNTIKIEERQIGLSFVQLTEPFFVNVDLRHLRKTIYHLLQNALKFTEQGEVIVSVEKDSENTTFSVKDSGCGIEEDNLPHIFERFRKFDSQSQQFVSGTGLGLSFSKWFVEQHGGKIWVDSKPGEGSIFYFTIPKTFKKDATLEEKQIIDRPKTIHEVSKNQLLKDRLILIAEDNDSNYKYIAAVFKHTGAKLYRANNGIEALELFKEHTNFSLVLMDLKMPEMDGYQALNEIKKLSPDTIVIAQTAYVHHETKDALLDKGFDAYIYKPIDRAKLMELIVGFIK